jgi:hypothetical protein
MSFYILRYKHKTNLDTVHQGTDPKVNLQTPENICKKRKKDNCRNLDKGRKGSGSMGVWKHGAPENFENQVSQIC